MCVCPPHHSRQLAGPQLQRGGRKKAVKIRQKNPCHHHRCQSREARENRPGLQVRTARSKTATRSVNWALFSIQTEWRRNAVRIRVSRNVEYVCNSSKSQSTRMNCIHCRTKHCTQEKKNLPKNPIFCTKSNAQTHGTRTARCKTTEIMHQISRANRASAKDRTNFRKPPWTDA